MGSIDRREFLRGASVFAAEVAVATLSRVPLPQVVGVGANEAEARARIPQPYRILPRNNLGNEFKLYQYGSFSFQLYPAVCDIYGLGAIVQMDKGVLPPPRDIPIGIIFHYTPLTGELPEELYWPVLEQADNVALMERLGVAAINKCVTGKDRSGLQSLIQARILTGCDNNTAKEIVRAASNGASDSNLAWFLDYLPDKYTGAVQVKDKFFRSRQFVEPTRGVMPLYKVNLDEILKDTGGALYITEKPDDIKPNDISNVCVAWSLDCMVSVSEGDIIHVPYSVKVLKGTKHVKVLPGVSSHYLGIPDGEQYPYIPKELKKPLGVEAAVIAHMLKLGMRVVVSDFNLQNGAALLAAHVAMELGYTADEAIAAIPSVRDGMIRPKDNDFLKSLEPYPGAMALYGVSRGTQ